MQIGTAIKITNTSYARMYLFRPNLNPRKWNWTNNLLECLENVAWPEKNGQLEKCNKVLLISVETMVKWKLKNEDEQKRNKKVEAYVLLDYRFSQNGCMIWLLFGISNDSWPEYFGQIQNWHLNFLTCCHSTSKKNAFNNF